eukprot:TRINITY_DN82130_c0_g1_i1.p1 TRINITY_DN82130_c0_g1~~TRINITY_DN82130_c0_g1_i1.p1  ORF type:complete len:406 (+),score=66.69 TRINITY_DN82130_c0_g1_i1:56-1273(+)
MKFQIEEIVHPDSQSGAKPFLCSICMCIMCEPVQTVCDHMFCDECVAPCLACPTCRTPLQQSDKKSLRECNRPMLRLMHDLKVWCPYHQQSKAKVIASTPTLPASSQREKSGEGPAAKRARIAQRAGHCDWTGSYTDLLAKHISECPFHIVPCPKGCGVMVARRDLEDHQPECSRNFEECTICRELVKVGAMTQHRKERAELHVQLLEAKLIEKESDTLEATLASFRDRLSAVETVVKACARTQYVKTRVDELKDQNNQLKDQSNQVKACVDELKAEVVQQMRQRRLQVSRVVWDIPDVADLKLRCPKGFARSSREFDLGNLGPFIMKYFPNGMENSRDDKAALCVTCPEHVKVKVRVKIGEKQSDFRECFAGTRCWNNFFKQADSGPLAISIELLDAEGTTSCV